MIKKHIKRRYKVQLPATDVKVNSGTQIHVPESTTPKDFKGLDRAFIITDDNQAVLCLIHNEQGNNHLLPIPDLTLIYFSQAQNAYSNYVKNKRELLQKTDFSRAFNNEGSMNEFYNFYISATSAVIFLSTALESFVNSMIPRESVYRRKNNKGVIEEFEHEQIQRWLTTEEKMEKVLPQLFERDFYKIQNKNTSAIGHLKKCRDSIIHTKVNKSEHLQETVIKELIRHDFNASIQATAAFMNFFSPNYIVECDCENDF